MEIGENVENKSIHAVQSVPIFSSAAAESSQRDEKEDRSTKESKNRRVSFASSTQLTQYLEPINPFESLGKLTVVMSQKVLTYENKSLLMELSSSQRQTTADDNFPSNFPK